VMFACCIIFITSTTSLFKLAHNALKKRGICFVTVW
jgi:hypothetical protein